VRVKLRVMRIHYAHVVSVTTWLNVSRILNFNSLFLLRFCSSFPITAFSQRISLKTYFRHEQLYKDAAVCRLHKREYNMYAAWFTDVANYGQEEECASCVTLTWVMLMWHKAMDLQNRAAAVMCMKKWETPLKHDRPDSKLVCTWITRPDLWRASQ
jgi:hypothetical protein